MTHQLETVNDPADLRTLSVPELVQLSREIRDMLISTVAKNGGHLAPSLGAVELTLALHFVFDTPKDKLIWDVGHQTYVHKIITGRRDRFHTIRQFKGLSGFIKPEESVYDTFAVGHASTAISAGLGMAAARDLAGDDYRVVSIVGDGALTGGLAFEGLNNAGGLKTDFIVVLNDNEMSISRNVGAIARYLTDIITNPVYNRIKRDIWELTGRMAAFGQGVRSLVSRLDEGIKALLVPGLLFERLGFRYIGPVDGHNLARLIYVLHQVRKMKGPIFVHILTRKGKGYRFAEQDASRFHGLSAFDPKTGSCASTGLSSYTDIFGKALVELGHQNPKIVAITAAMALGTGLDHFAHCFPERFFDVGIAEAHAATFAAGLARQGYRPVVAVYSTFSQRCYDQIIHDIGLQRLPVVFALDRAGLVGEDGPTHHGNFDLTFLRSVPGLVIMAPADENELRHMLRTALNYSLGPVAIRFPREAITGTERQEPFRLLPIGTSEIVRSGQDFVILAVGTMVHCALKAADLLQTRQISVQVVNVRYIKPLDAAMLSDVFSHFDYVVTLEENTLEGGYGGAVAEFICDHAITDAHLIRMGLPDQFIEHGKKSILLEHLGLVPDAIAEKLLNLIPIHSLKKLTPIKEFITHSS